MFIRRLYAQTPKIFFWILVLWSLILVSVFYFVAFGFSPPLTEGVVVNNEEWKIMRQEVNDKLARMERSFLAMQQFSHAPVPVVATLVGPSPCPVADIEPSLKPRAPSPSPSPSVNKFATAFHSICESHSVAAGAAITGTINLMQISTVQYDLKNHRSICSPYRLTSLNFKEYLIPMCVWPQGKDVYISDKIASGNVWDSDIVEQFVKRLKTKDGEGIVIDAGANIGQFSLIAAAMGHTVYAFEPFSENTELIKRSIQLNNMQDRIYLFRNALSDHGSVGSIAVPSTNRGGATVRELLSETIVEQDISIIRLDDIVPFIEVNHGEHPKFAFIKVDIEGFEPKMLTGASELLNRFDVPFIAMEISPKMWQVLGCDIAKTISAMQSLGYRTLDSHDRPINSSPQNYASSVSHLNTADVLFEKLY